MSLVKWLMVVVATVLFSTVSLSKAVPQVYIDNFTDGSLNLTQNSPGPAAETTETGLFQVMGGERFSSLQIVSLTTSPAAIKLEPTGGQILFSSDYGVVAEWNLVYGKNNDLNQDFQGGR